MKLTVIFLVAPKTERNASSRFTLEFIRPTSWFYKERRMFFVHIYSIHDLWLRLMKYELIFLLVQLCSSSLLSKQSSSPSQSHDFGIHLWLLHVKSHEFGQASTGGSAFGSEIHVCPSVLILSPYGHAHFTVSKCVPLTGTAKQIFSQPPLLIEHGCVGSTSCTS